ncbi:hypothetical protein [Raoultella ornithinolytica]|uniref:hypothetical protein n=1 Tax=Raoultella ornithinolytica TaxID=54291 RepID=UPI001601B0AC
MTRLTWMERVGYAAQALVRGFVGCLPMSDAEYGRKRAPRHLRTMPEPDGG